MTEGMPGLLPREKSQSPCLGDDELRHYNGKCNPAGCYRSALGPACDRKRDAAGTRNSSKYVCPSCNLEKGRHEFDSHPDGKRTMRCTACRAEAERQKREREREKNRVWKQAWKAKQKERART